LLVAAALGLAATGCNKGDDEGDAAGTAAQRTEAQPAAAAGSPASPADRRAIRAVLVRLLKTNDADSTCERSLTTRLFRQIYTGGPAACRKAEKENAKSEDKPTKDVVVTDIRTVKGHASAHVKVVGGDTDGAMGLVALTKEDDWRVDDLSTPFLRSTFNTSLAHDKDTPPKVVRCVTSAATRIPDGEFKPFSYGLLGHRPAQTKRLLYMVSRCDRRTDGRSVIRHPLEREIAKQLKKAGAPPDRVDCVLRRLRLTLSDKRIIELSVKDDKPSRDKITREVVAAALACRAGGSRPDPGQLSPA